MTPDLEAYRVERERRLALWDAQNAADWEQLAAARTWMLKRLRWAKEGSLGQELLELGHDEHEIAFVLAWVRRNFDLLVAVIRPAR